jgi:5-methylcytosine-specific restriction protein A
MNSVPFEIGETYHRVEEIHERFGGNRYSGISPCTNYPCVFVFFGESGKWHGYDDEFTDDGRFLYTGEGRVGDMTMDGGNAAIQDHKSNGNELHVFELGEGAWEVTYVGQYKYNTHYLTTLPDRNRNLREAIRFELVPSGGLDIDTGIRSLDDVPLSELRRQVEASVSGKRTVSTESNARTTYPRSEVVKRYALRVADGVCQGCSNEAPFVSTSGEPFLEVHHLHRRSDGGADNPDNVIALCPNCHRRVHYGRDGDDFNRQLIEHSE